MKLTSETIKLLESYAKINPHLNLNPGNQIATVNGTMTIYSAATITETIPSEFKIYDLKEFLSVLSLFKEPDLQFNGMSMTIVDLQNPSLYSHYYSADPSVIKFDNVPKPKSNPSILTQFKLTEKTFKTLEKGASNLGLHHIRFVANDETNNCLRAIAYDESGSKPNTITVTIDDKYQGPEFDVCVAIDKMCIVDGDYTCGVIANRALHMQHDERELMYIISIDQSTTK